jgi:biotin carboxyl carrier protein
MIKPEEIPALAQYLSANDIELFECSWPEGGLRLRFGEATADPTQPDAAEPAHRILKAPSIGVLRLCHPLGRAQPLGDGDLVQIGQLVAYLETGDVLLPIHAGQSGVVACWLADDGCLTGYGTPLIEFL